MYFDKLSGEIDDLLEKAEDENNIKFIGEDDYFPHEGEVVIEMLGFYGSVNQIIAKEVQKIALKKKKIAGIFSSYFSEMVQIISGEILLPITIHQVQIGSQPFILTTSNFSVPDIIGYQLAEELFKFYKRQKVSKILLIDGVYNIERNIYKKPQIHKIFSSDFQINVLNNEVADFTLIGQSACSFLTYWGYREDIPIEIVVVDSFSEYDPMSSLELLKNLMLEWGIKGDLNDLEKKSKEFKLSYIHSENGSEVERQEKNSDQRFFI
ncbi:MAG: PAC2 family protein [Candidatus Hodarchaeota archaeon]